MNKAVASGVQDNIINLSVNDLKASEKQDVDIITRFVDKVLNEQTVDEYVDSFISGKTTRAIYGEALKPFIEYLREQAEYFKVDLIIDFGEKEK